MWEYTDKVKEHFLNPRNVGEVENPDGVAEVGSIACGDALKLSFKLDENKRIKDIKFKTFGCASAIATSSALTEMVKGMTLEEAMKVTNQDIAAYLGGLPQEKMHCSVMGKQAMEKAIENYKGGPPTEPAARIICECFGVTEREIEQAVRENNLSTVEEVTNYTKAGGGCGGCHDAIRADHRESTGRSRTRSQTEALQHPEDQDDRGNDRSRNPAITEKGRRRYRTRRCHRQPRPRCHKRNLCNLQGRRYHT